MKYFRHRLGALRIVVALSGFAVGLGAVTVTQAACASAPSNLSPAAVSAWQKTRVIAGLDLLRDTAIAAEVAQPPLLRRNTVRAVVSYHDSALVVMDTLGTGWQVTIIAGLDQLLRNLPTDERATLAPYVGLVKSIIQEIR